MNVPRVSVIVPVFNSAATIQACVESLLAQDYPDAQYELIVVNNGSTDQTAVVLDRYRDRIRLLVEKKRGASAARNRGLKAAEGEFIAFMDADCIAEKDWLKHIIPPLEDVQIGIAGGRILALRPTNDIGLFGEVVHDHHQAIELSKPGYAITMNWSSRSSVIEQAGGFDENLLRGQDVDLAWRILQCGYRLFYEPAAIVYHRNECTLLGIFHEGFTHGYHGMRVTKKHARWLRKWKYNRWQWRSYGGTFEMLLKYAQKKGTADDLCAGIFNAGKHMGRVLGGARWFYPGL